MSQKIGNVIMLGRRVADKHIIENPSPWMHLNFLLQKYTIFIIISLPGNTHRWSVISAFVVYRRAAVTHLDELMSHCEGHLSTVLTQYQKE